MAIIYAARLLCQCRVESQLTVYLQANGQMTSHVSLPANSSRNRTKRQPRPTASAAGTLCPRLPLQARRLGHVTAAATAALYSQVHLGLQLGTIHAVQLTRLLTAMPLLFMSSYRCCCCHCCPEQAVLQPAALAVHGRAVALLHELQLLLPLLHCAGLWLCSCKL